MRRLAEIHALILCVSFIGPVAAAQEASDPVGPTVRRAIVGRAQDYLFSLPKDGAVGETRKKAVTAAFVLASLSSGILPEDGEHGAALRSSLAWVQKNSSTAFFGGREEPNADHALAALMLTETIGMLPTPDANAQIHQRAELAVDYSLKIQNKGVGAKFYGGWRPNDQTRVNSRMLTAWYLWGLRSAALRGLSAPKSNFGRAVKFVLASQHSGKRKPEEAGGFSVDASGLPVRSTTAAGLAVLSILDADNEEAIVGARDWLGRHPPRWHGPNFFESSFFAIRGLYRTRHLDGGKVFASYFARLVKMLRERQQADGSVPFPPGHGGPVLKMGLGYSTAFAVLILNVDRGLIPMDRE